jgi:hypothetical protein
MSFGNWGSHVFNTNRNLTKSRSKSQYAKIKSQYVGEGNKNLPDRITFQSKKEKEAGRRRAQRFVEKRKRRIGYTIFLSTVASLALVIYLMVKFLS